MMVFIESIGYLENMMAIFHILKSEYFFLTVKN